MSKEWQPESADYNAPIPTIAFDGPSYGELRMNPRKELTKADIARVLTAIRACVQTHLTDDATHSDIRLIQQAVYTDDDQVHLRYGPVLSINENARVFFEVSSELASLSRLASLSQDELDTQACRLIEHLLIRGDKRIDRKFRL